MTRRGRRVQSIYDALAWRYDLSHHLQTLWRDVAWRSKAAAAVPRGTKPILDLCTGTGLVLQELHARFLNRTIVGTDSNPSMISRARDRCSRRPGVTLVRADAQHLPFGNGTFDAALVVCGLGGVDRPEAALREVIRVLAPQGLFFAIEMCTPRGRGFRHFLHRAVLEPCIDRLWGFRAIDLEALARAAGLAVVTCDYRIERLVGSVCELVAKSPGLSNPRD